MTRVYNWFGGRCTFFALFFAITGFLLAWHSRLTPQYAVLIGALQGWVVVHSAKEDYFTKEGK